MIFGEDRVRELERRVADLMRENVSLRAEVQEFRSKEQSISNAIIASMEHAKQLETSRKKLYSLDIQRSRLLYLRMEQIINDLYRRYPELRKDDNLRDISDKFKTMVFNDLADNTVENSSYDIKTPSEDPIKKLLKNIIDAFDEGKQEEKSKVNNYTPPSSNLSSIPTIPKMSAVQRPKQEKVMPANIGVSASGFDLNEALHPTMELDEIMKAFNVKDNKGNK